MITFGLVSFKSIFQFLLLQELGNSNNGRGQEVGEDGSKLSMPVCQGPVHILSLSGSVAGDTRLLLLAG